VISAGYALAPGGSRRLRLGALACVGVLVVPLVVSFSRGTWIATAVACAAMTLLAGRRQALRILAVAAASGCVLVGGVGVGSQMISQRVASITQVTSAPDPSVTDRYALWAAAVSMWREHPVAGVGLKRFPDERDAHASLALSSGSDTAGAGQAFAREPLLSPHNMYLLVLSEQGMLGCALLTASWAALLIAGTTRLTPHLPGRPPTGNPTARPDTPAAGKGRAPDDATPSRPGTRAPGDDRAPARPGARASVPAGRRAAPPACGLAAVGLLLWTCVDFLYADIGGPATVLTALVLGLCAWWPLHLTPVAGPRPARRRLAGAASGPAHRPAAPAPATRPMRRPSWAVDPDAAPTPDAQPTGLPPGEPVSRPGGTP